MVVKIRITSEIPMAMDTAVSKLELWSKDYDAYEIKWNEAACKRLYGTSDKPCGMSFALKNTELNGWTGDRGNFNVPDWEEQKKILKDLESVIISLRTDDIDRSEAVKVEISFYDNSGEDKIMPDETCEITVDPELTFNAEYWDQLETELADEEDRNDDFDYED